MKSTKVLAKQYKGILVRLERVTVMGSAMAVMALAAAQQTVVAPEDYGQVVDGTSFTTLGTALVSLLALAVAAGLGYLILNKQAQRAWTYIRKFF